MFITLPSPTRVLPWTNWSITATLKTLVQKCLHRKILDMSLPAEFINLHLTEIIFHYLHFIYMASIPLNSICLHSHFLYSQESVFQNPLSVSTFGTLRYFMFCRKQHKYYSLTGKFGG